MREMLVTIFNDLDENNCRALEQHVASLPDISRLKYPPSIYNEEVGTSIVQKFESLAMIPTLMFVDPWGYKGLSLRLINSVLKNWGCDCVFFFNYNRINMGLTNRFVVEHMNALFEKGRADQLRTRLQRLVPYERELLTVNELGLALQEMGGEYVLPFRFKNDSGERTSHHLIFVSKHPLGYGIMKDIMASYSSSQQQGVPSFEYNPVHDRQYRLLFDYARPLDDLAGLLVTEYRGKTLTLQQVYERHNIGTPYVKKNYKDVLARLEQEGHIKANPPAAQRPKRNGMPTFADNVRVTFL
jgi:three-Cys-motif partner protein